MFESQTTSRYKGSELVKFFFAIVTLLIVLALTIVLVIFCRKYMIKRCPSSVKDLTEKIERKLLFNSVLRAILEVYFSTCVMMAISMRHIDTYDYEGKINVATILILAGFCLGFPYFVWKWMNSNQDNLDEKRYRQSYDSLYLNIEVDKGPIAIAFSFVFLLRRLLFALTIGLVMQGITI